MSVDIVSLLSTVFLCGAVSGPYPSQKITELIPSIGNIHGTKSMCRSWMYITDMISEEEAIELLHAYAIHESRITHSRGVASFAFHLAERIHKLHPELPVDPQKVRIAALLHDIGRSQDGDHEQNTTTILQEEGLGDIAAITMHGSYYEIMILRGIDNPDLLPQTIENKIVAYADTRFKDQLVSMEERWAEIEQRRKNEPEKIRSLHMAKGRFRNMEKELLRLADEGTGI